MSKYTTEVRFICEQNASLEASVGGNGVDIVLESSWDKIFNSNFPIFDENYRKILCKKILKHYYTREIGAETVSLWKLWLNQRMDEIMPYYNQLYESARLEFNPFYDVDITRTHEKEYTDNTNREDNTKTSSNENNNSTNYDLFSETPQGALTGVENEEYLTNARKQTNNNNSNMTGNIENNGKTDVNGNEKYSEIVKGKQGTTDYSTLLTKYRQTFLNIDMLIIDELKDLFMLLW